MSWLVTPGSLNRRAQVYDQLGSMSAAGVPLLKSLEMAGRQSRSGATRRYLARLAGEINAGFTLTDSMARVHGWLPEFDRAILSVGEQSGRLDSSFKLLGQFCAARSRIIRDTISGMFMTWVTLHVFLLIFPLGLLIQFVVDGFMNQHGASFFPFLLEKGLVFGGLYGAVFFLVFACQGRRGLQWRAFVESLFQFAPFLRTGLRSLALSRLSASLEALLNAGVNVTRAWEIAAGAAGSPRLLREVQSWPPQFEAGETPSGLINQSRCFPEVFANLYQTGEISGKLDETLGRLQVYYQEEGFRNLKLFSRILNGVIYAAVVITVAINIIQFWMHYYAAALSAGG